MTDFGSPMLIALLTAEERQILRSLGIRRTVQDGEILHERGESDPAMGVVVSGALRLVRRTRDGSEVFLMAVNPGQNFGDNLMFGADSRTHHSVAIGSTVVDFYPRARFQQLLEHPGIVRALYEVSSFRLGQAVEILDDLRSYSPELRLAKHLLALNSRAEHGRIVVVQQDLANLLGVSALTVAKALRKFKQLGLVATGYGHIKVTDPDYLEDWVAEQSV